MLLQIGTFSIAIAAKAMNKPLYVVAESFKFVRLFPLNQHDLPDEFKVNITLHSASVKDRIEYYWGNFLHKAKNIKKNELMKFEHLAISVHWKTV